MTDRSPILEITTEEIPAQLFTVDGEEYELYSTAHLTPEQESQVTANFARSQSIVNRLTKAKNDREAEALAKKLRPLRERLIGIMTSMPPAKISELHPKAQGQIMDVIADEIAAGEEEDEEDDLG